VACIGVGGGCDGLPPWASSLGASNDPVFVKRSVGKCLKILKEEKKGYETGHPGYGGIPRKVVRII